jgi:hypothetical protein
LGRGSENIEIGAVVPLAEEDALAPIAALRDMMRRRDRVFAVPGCHGSTAIGGTSGRRGAGGWPGAATSFPTIFA